MNDNTVYVLDLKKEKKSKPKKSEGMDQDVYTLYTSTPMFQAMKPLFISLQLVGLYHKKSYGCVMTCMKRNNRHCSWCTNLAKVKLRHISISQIYNWLMFFVMLFSFLRYFASYRELLPLGTQFFLTIAAHIWAVFCLLGQVTCLRASHRYEGIPQFFIEWKRVLDEINIDFDKQKLYKISVICTALAWIFILCNMSFIAYLAWPLPDFMTPLFGPFADQNDYARPLIIILILTQNFSWIFPIIVDNIFCTILYTQFTIFNDNFRKKCNHGQFQGNLGEERMKHQKICRLVRHADDFLSLYNASNFVCNISMMILIVYNIVYDAAIQDSSWAMFIAIFWFGCGFTFLSICCIGGAMVNHAVSTVFVYHYCELFTNLWNSEEDKPDAKCDLGIAR